MGRFYVEHGERYFRCTSGIATMTWDGTFHIAAQAVMAHRALTGRPLGGLAMVWVGSISFSLLPVLLGAAVGPFSADVQWSILLNQVFPGWVFTLTAPALSRRARTGGPRQSGAGRAASALVAACHVSLILAHLVRVMVLHGSQAQAAEAWALRVEPVLVQDKQGFLLVQALQWFVWCSPLHVAFATERAYHAATGNRSDGALFSLEPALVLVMLGAYVQGEAVHCLTGALQWDYFDLGRRDPPAPASFWVVNATIVAIATGIAMEAHAAGADNGAGGKQQHVE